MELRKLLLRPGGLVDVAFFLSGLFLTFAGALGHELRDVPLADRHRTLASESFALGLASWVMPLAFGVFQGRRARDGYLFPRRPARTLSFLAGVAVGVAHYSVTRIGTMWSVLIPLLILPWCASRALWTTNHNPSKANGAGR